MKILIEEIRAKIVLYNYVTIMSTRQIDRSVLKWIIQIRFVLLILSYIVLKSEYNIIFNKVMEFSCQSGEVALRWLGSNLNWENTIIKITLLHSIHLLQKVVCFDQRTLHNA